MRVSIVICTLNRAAGLRNTVESLRHQRHRDFEVVVVNGPSTDDTAQVLDEFSTEVKLRQCPAANLSMSRNIGIAAAAGEVVAFIDDDALPEFGWLHEALAGFDADDVAGVGGIVFDHTGMALQYRYSAADRFGNASTGDGLPFDGLAAPGSFTFPYLQGTNALFRRSLLEAVGGFDETYDYYLDETDLCCRLVDAGYRLRQLPNAAVHHKFLSSAVRDHHRVITNWYPMVRNHVYFGLRHAQLAATELQIIDNTRRFIDRCLADAWSNEVLDRLPPGSAEAASIAMGGALVEGIARGRSRADVRLPRLDPPTTDFLPFRTIHTAHPIALVIVSSDYPPRLTGGVARFLGDLAPELARRGHDVRVITRALDPADTIGTVDLEDGVWVHRVPCPTVEGGFADETFPHINAFAAASATELERICGFADLDLVYGPAWDVDVLGALRTTPLPIVTMLATPVSVALDVATSDAALDALLRLEHEVFRSSDFVHAISAAIVETISERYPNSLDPDRTMVAPIGLRDHGADLDQRCVPPRRDGLDVLYTGRLEPRKGVDVLLQAIERLAPTLPNVRWHLVGADNERDANGSSPTVRWAERHKTAPWRTQVDLVGPADDVELHRRYATADIVVLPSRYESFGLVMAEAMMHGRPVISSAVGGIEEVVRHGDDGLLVPPGDVEELSAALSTLLADEDERQRLGANGRQRFVDHLTIEVAAGRLESLLRSAMLCRPGGPEVTVCGADEQGRTFLELRPRTVVTVDLDGPWSCKLIGRPAARLLISGETRQCVIDVTGLSMLHWDDAGPTTIEVVGGTCRFAGVRPLARRAAGTTTP